MPFTLSSLLKRDPSPSGEGRGEVVLLKQVFLFCICYNFNYGLCFFSVIFKSTFMKRELRSSSFTHDFNPSDSEVLNGLAVSEMVNPVGTFTNRLVAAGFEV